MPTESDRRATHALCHHVAWQAWVAAKLGRAPQGDE